MLVNVYEEGIAVYWLPSSYTHFLSQLILW